jgi:two-component system, LuxR family, sensor kinase FixL
MQNTIRSAGKRSMKLSPTINFSLPAAGFLYLCAYVLLDLLTDALFAEKIGVTLWHPSVGLSLCLMLLWGTRALPLLFIAPFLAEVAVSGNLALAAMEATAAGVGYSLAIILLLHPKVRFDTSLGSLREVFILITAAIVSSAVVSASYMAMLLAAGVLQSTEFSASALRYWVGDMVGIATVAPFGLLAIMRERLIKPDWQVALQVAIILFALAVAVGSAEKERLQLFFLLFLPITWIAVSSGLEGVSMALLVTQIGLIAALQFFPGPMIDFTALQARMLVLTVTGLVAGALVTENRRADQKLRENQAAIARLTRLGSMAELAIAIAHEVNQPLSAAGTYTRLVTESLAGETLKDPTVIVTARKATAQVERAADVIKRLRALVRKGHNELSSVQIDTIVRESLDRLHPILERRTVVISVQIEPNLPPALADRIQIEQVLFNLLRNSAEAITNAALSHGRITVEAVRASAQLAQIRVIDSGPGFPVEILRAPPPFSSTKADGLGVGLSLCRSIVEAHGGSLRIESTKNGACVSFTLPFAEAFHHGG